MNLQTNSPKKPTPAKVEGLDDIEFDFKPITSGLGFHSNKTTEIKPAFSEGPSVSMPMSSMPSPQQPMARKESNQIYQNELSVFYNRDATPQMPVEELKVEKIVRNASKSQRVVAYLLDLALVLSCVGIVLTIMAKIIDRDLLEVWNSYPNEITPLVVILFTGFYLMYFSIYDKTPQSTLGKNLMNLRVVDQNNKSPSFSILVFRSFISLMNFISLGLFSYFDLQNKVANTKVIKVD